MSDYEWTKNLKPGDKVYVQSGYIGEYLKIHTVKNITPKGKVRLDNGKLFTDGFRRVEGYASNEFLVKWTQELEDRIKFNDMINKKRKDLRSVNWSLISQVLIDQIHDLVFAELK